MALPKPDPTRYRGGSTSRLYKEDLQAWLDSQDAEPEVGAVGEEEVVSLASTFDTEADPFAPDMGAGSGFRETGDTTTTSDPFADYARASREGSEFIATYSDDPAGYADVLAGSDLPYMDYTDEMLQDVRFQTPEPGQYQDFGGRLISGETGEYERVFVYNEMLNRGLDEQTARTWYDSGDDEVAAYNLIAQNHNAKQDNYLEAMSDLLESDNRAEFTERYNESDFRGKIAVANMLREQGTISDEQFEQLYVNEWNASQEGKPRPTYIVKAKAPKPPLDADQEHQWDFGEEVYTYYQPNEPVVVPEDTMSVIDPKSFVPPGEDASDLQVMQYYDYMSPVSSRTRPSSEWVQFRDELLLPGLRLALAVGTGGVSEQLYSAFRLASGETLTGADWANLTIGGLEAFDVIKAPTTFTDPVTGVTHTLAGTGLDVLGLGLDYNQSVQLLNALGNQDAVGVFNLVTGGEQLNKVLTSLGVPQNLIDDPDFITGVTDGLQTALESGDLGEGFEQGLETYIKEGGGFGGTPDIMSFDLGALEDVLKPIVDTVSKVVEPVGDAIQAATEPFVDVIDEGIDILGEEVVDPALDLAETAVETTGDLVQDATEPLVDLIDEGIDTLGEEVVDPALQAAEDFVESLDGPDIDLPDVDLPDLKFDLSGLFAGMGAAKSATRTTDSLFAKEKEEYRPVKLMNIPLIETPQRQRRQRRELSQPQETVDLFSNPFANPFDRTI